MSRVGNLYMHVGLTYPYVFLTPTKYLPHDKSYPNYSRIPIINWTRAKCTLDSTTKNGLGLVWHILYSGLLTQVSIQIGFNALSYKWMSKFHLSFYGDWIVMLRYFDTLFVQCLPPQNPYRQH